VAEKEADEEEKENIVGEEGEEEEKHALGGDAGSVVVKMDSLCGAYS
jgi:hypothetical protein